MSSRPNWTASPSTSAWDDVPFVRDTRFSEDPIETTLSQAEIALIKVLDSRWNLPVAMQRLATQYLITASEAEKILVKFKTKRWIIEEDNSAVSLIVDHSEEQRAIDKIVAQKCESTDSKLILLYIEALALRRADDGVRYKKISRDVSIRDRSLYALIVPGDICIDHFSQG